LELWFSVSLRFSCKAVIQHVTDTILHQVSLLWLIQLAQPINEMTNDWKAASEERATLNWLDVDFSDPSTSSSAPIILKLLILTTQPDFFTPTHVDDGPELMLRVIASWPRLINWPLDLLPFYVVHQLVFTDFLCRMAIGLYPPHSLLFLLFLTIDR